MTVATLPFPTTQSTLPTLRIGQRELTVDQVFRYLSTSKLLPQFVRDIILEDALQIVPYTPEDLEATGRSLAQQQQYRHLDWDSLKILALRFLRVEKFKELSWGKSIESYFLKRRYDLDQVICSIIQTPDSSLAQELYFRIQNEETAKELGTVLPTLLQAPDPISSIAPEPLVISDPATEESDRSAPEPALPQTVGRIPNISSNLATSLSSKPDLRRKHRFASALNSWPIASSVIGGMLLATGAGTYWLSQEQAVEATPTTIASILQSQQNLVQPAYDQAMTAAGLTQIAQTPEQWTQVMEHWQAALAVLTTVPADHPQFKLAQEKQGLYQRNLAYAEQQYQNQVDPFREAVEAATEAAAKGKTAVTIEDWSAVSTLWQTALESMAAVPEDYPRYAIAQQRVPIYQANWEYVQYRIQQAVN